MPTVSPEQWDEFIAIHPDSHILQSRHWGDLKRDFGWQTHWIISDLESSLSNAQIGAQLLFRKLPINFTLAYMPKGPVGSQDALINWYKWKNFWSEVDNFCRKINAVFLVVEPDIIVDDHLQGGNINRALLERSGGFTHGIVNIQPMRTIMVDTHGTEDEILARMNQKTRYNIRLAHKKGVVVAPSEDIENFFKMMEITGERDLFGIHSKQYYKRAYELFYQNGSCNLLFASFQRELLGAIFIFAQGSRAWYFYGASSNSYREMMPNYLLQWEAIRWARNRGCNTYDLWGVPDENENVLEQYFQQRSDGLWGVYRFKRGFGGKVIRSSGPWDRVYISSLYSILKLWMRIKTGNQNHML